MKQAWLPKAVFFKGLKTALFVGSLLTLINQWSSLFGAEPFKWLPFFLTYLVPFCVFIYSFKSNQNS